MKAKRSRPSAKRARPSRPASRPGARKPRAARPLITTVIFDLDDTLYDCFKQRVQLAHRHAAAAMVEAGVAATVDQVFKVRMSAFKKDPHLHYIDSQVFRRFKVSNPQQVEMLARAAYFSTPVGKLTLFPSSLHVLRTLAARGVRNFIVSFGDPETQHAKVMALGLHEEKSVKKVFYADTGNLMTKDAIFMVIHQHEEKDPQRILVVGDRASSEIKAGNALGFHTARLRHGEFLALDPAGPEEEPDHNIHSIGDVLRLPYRFGK
ncbi:MAG TPA: HAD family hydrolase [Terriglobales bacterium]|nr:HAD family hydrolase [Terriglobales bacterium]